LHSNPLYAAQICAGATKKPHSGHAVLIKPTLSIDYMWAQLHAGAAQGPHSSVTRFLLSQPYQSTVCGLNYVQELLRDHIVVTLFLTMLVGAGGNAGNQSAIKVIRGLVSACFVIINDASWSGRQHWIPECNQSHQWAGKCAF